MLVLPRDDDSYSSTTKAVKTAAMSAAASSPAFSQVDSQMSFRSIAMSSRWGVEEYICRCYPGIWKIGKGRYSKYVILAP